MINLIIYLLPNEEKFIKKAFNKKFFSSIKIINYTNDDDFNNNYLFLYNTNIYNNINNLSKKCYVIENKINIQNIIDIINLLNIETSFYYSIYNDCIVSNNLFIDNPDKVQNKYKNIYCLNSFRIFDKNGKYINNQTYNENLDGENISAHNSENFNKICFYLNNIWSFNYHCQFMELFPMIIIIKLLLMNENNNYDKIDILFNNNYKDSYIEIFKIFNIDDKINFIGLDNLNNNSNSNNYYYHKLFNFGTNLLHRNDSYQIHNIFTEFLKYYFFDTYKDKINNYNDKVALLRDSQNNNNTWSERCISNNIEVIELLKNNDFSIINTEKMSLADKFINLSNKKIIIVEAGASLPNLYFIKKHKTKLIILCNENMYNFHGIYENQIRYHFKNYNVFICNMTNDNSPKNNENVNQPFIVDVNKLMDIIINLE